MNQRKAGALLSYVYLTLTLCVGLVYTPFSIRLLGDSEYGVFAVAISAISFMMILDMGFNQTMIRYVARYKALGDNEGVDRLNGLFLTFYLVIAAIALVAGAVLSFFIEDIFAATGTGFTAVEASRLKIIFVILLINLVLSFPLGIYASILNANEGFVFLKLVNIVNFVLMYGGMTVALFLGGKAIVLAIITTTVSLLTKTVQAIYVQRKYKVRFLFKRKSLPKDTELNNDNMISKNKDFEKLSLSEKIKMTDRALIKEIFGFSFFIFLNILIDQLYANTDKFILGAIKGSVVVTVYTVGVTFQQYFEQFSTSISGVFLPRITKLITTEKDMTKVNEIFVRIGRIQFIMLGFLMSGFVVFGKKFITLWVGADKLGAYGIALVVIIPGLIPLSQNIGISVIRALNKHRFRSIVYIIIAVINVALSIPLAYKFGGFGAACATGFGTFLGQILTMNWFYYKKIGLDIPGYWKETLKITAVIVPVAFVGWGISLIPIWNSGALSGWFGFLLLCFIYLIVFFVAGWMFIFNKYERNLISEMIKRILLLLIKIIPMKEDVLFESNPDFSDNARVIYDELIKREYNKKHRIYWAIHDEENVPDELPYNVQTVNVYGGFSKKIKRYIAQARCKYIIDSNSYIHKFRSKQIRLHLGHGMPIKFLPEYTNYNEIGKCDGYVICGDYWKEIYTEKAHIPEGELLTFGYPRNDILAAVYGKDNPTYNDSTAYRKNNPGSLKAIHKKEKFIIWMPTYRQHKNEKQDDEDDMSKKYEAGFEKENRWELLAMAQLRKKKKSVMPYGMPEIESAKQLDELDKKLGKYGLMLYFRPHPAQDMRYITELDPMNIRVADDEFLGKCGASLYELISYSQALITDYSSVYFDYLLTGRPIGLTIRDEASFFEKCECVFDDLENDLAGEKLKSFEDVMFFVDGVASNINTDYIDEAREKFHDTLDGTSTAQVLEWLAAHGLAL